MIILTPFNEQDFDTLISWIDREELLITIAGFDLRYPLTHEQLHQYLAIEGSHAFNIVNSETTQTIGHAELVLSGNRLYKIDKLLIGDPATRGKGMGQLVIHELLQYAFEQLDAATVELNVFDWNHAGIRWYEKCGFVSNPGKVMQFRVADKNWTAINMRIDRTEWEISAKA